MNKNVKIFCACLAVCTGVSAQYQEKDTTGLVQLDEVVVSDSRFALKRENSGKTVISISAAELAQFQGRSVAEIINRKSGIEINGSRSNAGQNFSIYARGGNNRQVLVLIDDIQVSDPSSISGQYDLRLLNLAQIENIEIIKGAASTLYGNSAATAVIYITTKTAKEDGVSATVESSIGTDQSQNNQDYNVADFSNAITIQAKKDKLSILASGGHQFTDGLSAAIGEESDLFSKLDGSVKLGYQFNDRFNVTLATYYTKMASDYDNGFPIEDADFNFDSEQSRFALSSVYKYGKGSINANVAFNQIIRTFVSNFPSEFDSESIIIDVFNKYIFNDTFYTILGVNAIDATTVFTEEQNTTSVDPYANAVYVSDFGLNVNASLRLNNHSEYGNNLVYSLNPSYNIATKSGSIKFLGSYATSFIAPNLSQLFGPFGANADLNPEENTTVEGGFEYNSSKAIRLSVVYFQRNEQERIRFVNVDPVNFVSQYQNTPEEIKFRGVELELAVTPLKNVNLTANYTFTESDSDLALRVPKTKVNSSLGYTLLDKTFFSLEYQYVSERTDADFSTFTNVDLSSFNLFNIYAKHDVCDKFGLFIAVDNIFNENYTELLNYTTRGRNVRLGMRVNL